MTLVVIEELSKVCATSGLIIAVQELGSLGIKLAGTPEQKERFLPKLASGEWLAAYALTEPESGSDSAAMRTTARRDGDDYVLDGGKRFITNAGVAHVYVVFAKTDPNAGHDGISAFVVEADRARVLGGADRAEDGDQGLDDRRGVLRLLPHPRRQPARRARGRGSGSRCGSSTARAPGSARRDSASPRARPTTRSSTRAARETMGKPIAEHQLIAGMLADMETRCEAARGLLYKVGQMIDEGDTGPELTRLSAMAKLYCTDTAMAVTTDAVQILGGYGYVQRVSRRADDARRQDHPDLRGHQPDPAPRDRPRDAPGAAHAPAVGDGCELTIRGTTSVPSNEGCLSWRITRKSRSTTLFASCSTTTSASAPSAGARFGEGRAGSSSPPESFCSSPAQAPPRGRRARSTTRCPPPATQASTSTAPRRSASRRPTTRRPRAHPRRLPATTAASTTTAEIATTTASTPEETTTAAPQSTTLASANAEPDGTHLALTIPDEAAGPTSLTIQATRGDSWVEVRLGSSTGRLLQVGTMNKGSSSTVQGPRLWVRFGNVGNLDLLVNGKPVHPSHLGTITVIVTPSGLKG